MNREQWRIFYRMLRIARRETSKCMVDVICYGTGFVEIGKDVPDLIRYVPIHEMFNSPLQSLTTNQRRTVL